MDNDIKSLIYSKNVVEFVTVANEYCGFLETATDNSKLVFIDKCQKLISLLYLKASMLPLEIPTDEEDVETFVTELDWQLVKNGISALLGDSDMYLDYFDQEMNETHEPVTCHISENLADTYQDLKDFLEIYKLGNEYVSCNALYKCQANFGNYWGFKIAATLKIIHILKQQPTDETDSSITYEDNKRNTQDWFISKAQQQYKKNG